MITVFPKGLKNEYQLQKTLVGLEFLPIAHKFVSIPLTGNVRSLTQVIPKSEVNDQYGYANWTVFQYSSLIGFLDLEKKLSHPLNVDKKCIRTFNGIVDAREVEVSVVLSRSKTVQLWRANFAADVILKNILSFFFVSHSSLIVVPEQCFNQFGVKYICVHNAGSRKSVSRVIDNTTIKIRDIYSISIFECLCADDNTNRVEALDDHIAFLNFIYNAHVFQKSRRIDPQRKLVQKILLNGPSGCGKTCLVKYFTQSQKCGLITVEAWRTNYLAAGKVQKMLNSYLAEAISLSQEQNNGCCVLLLDEFESICRKKRQGTFSRQSISYMIQRFLEAVDDYPGLIVIATTNNIELLHSNVRCAGKMQVELHIGPPTELGRSKILQIGCGNFKMPKSICEKVANLTPGFLGTDLNSLIRNVARTRSNNPTLYRNEKDLLKLFKTLALKKACFALRSGLGVSSFQNIEMRYVGGLNAVKLCLKLFIEWPLLHSEAFRRLGLPVPKGILLYGPPGCAKTTLAQAIANSLNTNFLHVSAAELYSAYVGEAEKNVITLFDKARLSRPCIIFIDEIDTLAGNRNASAKSVQSKILSTFLTEMDGVGNRLDVSRIKEVTDDENEKKKIIDECSKNVIIIAATNRPDKLDSALLRPGRFDKLVFVGPPNFNDRMDILNSILQQWKMPVDVDLDLSEIADKTENFSGADLKLLLKEAGYEALLRNKNVEQIKQEDLIAALQVVKPTSTNKYSNLYETF